MGLLESARQKSLMNNWWLLNKKGANESLKNRKSKSKLSNIKNNRKDEIVSSTFRGINRLCMVKETHKMYREERSKKE